MYVYHVDVAEAEKSRRNTSAQCQPVRIPKDHSELFNGPGRHRHVGGGRQVCGGPVANHAVPAIRQPFAQHTIPGLRVRAAVHGRLLGMHGAPLHGDHLPSGGHRQNGTEMGPHRRGGPTAPSVRRRGPARGRRVYHAHVGQRQH